MNKSFKLALHRIPTELTYPLFAWSQESPNSAERDAAWDRYCDVRDAVPSGVSQKFRIEHSWKSGEAKLDADELSNVIPMRI